MNGWTWFQDPIQLELRARPGLLMSYMATFHQLKTAPHPICGRHVNSRIMDNGLKTISVQLKRIKWIFLCKRIILITQNYVHSMEGFYCLNLSIKKNLFIVQFAEKRFLIK